MTSNKRVQPIVPSMHLQLFLSAPHPCCSQPNTAQLSKSCFKHTTWSSIYSKCFHPFAPRVSSFCPLRELHLVEPQAFVSFLRVNPQPSSTSLGPDEGVTPPFLILLITRPTLRPTPRLTLNPRIGPYLLGLPKPMRNQSKPSLIFIPLHFPCFLRDSIGRTPIGRGFPTTTTTEEPHQVVFRATPVGPR
ncbi:hypothetical protein DEO72_LG10g1413 [Vigna unguiculata]|uniref:Uncharacterized protein n=1 Tax=Vigna unguiculata TaxID=3917 RepID=A0A4D6NE83_VIGUN|nr:hypothetical protein DEO72_LG10g1413 [Vigna unguiculata]